jgi:hypothetical protein
VQPRLKDGTETASHAEALLGILVAILGHEMLRDARTPTPKGRALLMVAAP